MLLSYACLSVTARDRFRHKDPPGKVWRPRTNHGLCHQHTRPPWLYHITFITTAPPQSTVFYNIASNSHSTSSPLSRQPSTALRAIKRPLQQKDPKSAVSVDELPVEILGAISLEVVTNPAKGSTPRLEQNTILSVSRRWHDIILNTPGAWRHFCRLLDASVLLPALHRPDLRGTSKGGLD